MAGSHRPPEERGLIRKNGRFVPAIGSQSTTMNTNRGVSKKDWDDYNASVNQPVSEKKRRGATRRNDAFNEGAEK